MVFSASASCSTARCLHLPPQQRMTSQRCAPTCSALRLTLASRSYPQAPPSRPLQTPSAATAPSLLFPPHPQQQRRVLACSNPQDGVPQGSDSNNDSIDDTSCSGSKSPAEHEEPGASLSNAIHFSLSEVAKIQGRSTNSTNLFLVNESEDSWRRLDKKVNQYPIQRSFTGIGPGGDGFRAEMLQAVVEVVGPVHVECMSERASSKGSYLSITIGPVWVESCDQVIQIYGKLKEVAGIKWII